MQLVSIINCSGLTAISMRQGERRANSVARAPPHKGRVVRPLRGHAVRHEDGDVRRPARFGFLPEEPPSRAAQPKVRGEHPAAET